MKYSLDKLKLGNHTPAEFIDSIEKLGIKYISPSPAQYATYYLLPKMDKHKDPFDRMIIWQALQSGLTLISRDEQISQYELHGLTVV